MDGRKIRRQGKAGEDISAARLSKLTGTKWARRNQYGGGPFTADVHCLGSQWLDGELHVEVKHGLRVNIRKAMEQSIREAGTRLPIVHAIFKQELPGQAAPGLIVVRDTDLMHLVHILDHHERQMAKGDK